MSQNQLNDQQSSENLTVTKVSLVNDKTLVFTLSASKKIRTFLLSDKVFVEYDKSIKSLDKSILSIPIIGGLITIAWAQGADFFIEKIDQNYLKSLRNIAPIMSNSFPKFQFSKIKVNQVIPNSFHNNRYGLLFSCGVDSITSYIKHRNKKPVLIFVHGIDVRSDDDESWKKTSEMLENFSTKEGIKINVIKTNVYEIVDRDLLHRKFGLDWWQNVNHGIALTGLAAPLTCLTGIKSLLLSSGTSDSMGFIGPSGASPHIINKLSWGSTKVHLDNNQFTRQLKIRNYLKQFTEQNYYPFLKVCNKYEEPASNCGVCEKCYHTIVGLVLEGIDPNKCGFNNIDAETFEEIKSRFNNKNLLTKKIFIESVGQFNSRMQSFLAWKDIHKQIPEDISHNVCGSRDFLEWFRTFDLSKYLKNIDTTFVISPSHILLYFANSLCAKAPKNMRIILNQLISSLSHRYEKIRWD